MSPKPLKGFIHLFISKWRSLTADKANYSMCLKDSVSTQLWERFDEKAIKHTMSCRVATASVKDLIETERQYLLSQASFRLTQYLPSGLKTCKLRFLLSLILIASSTFLMHVVSLLQWCGERHQPPHEEANRAPVTMLQGRRHHSESGTTEDSALYN